MYRSELRERLCQVAARILVILQTAGKIVFVRRQIEVSVPAEAEKYVSLATFLTCCQRLIDGSANRVGRFGGRQNALGAGKL